MEVIEVCCALLTACVARIGTCDPTPSGKSEHLSLRQADERSKNSNVTRKGDTEHPFHVLRKLDQVLACLVLG